MPCPPEHKHFRNGALHAAAQDAWNFQKLSAVPRQKFASTVSFMSVPFSEDSSAETHIEKPRLEVHQCRDQFVTERTAPKLRPPGFNCHACGEPDLCPRTPGSTELQCLSCQAVAEASYAAKCFRKELELQPEPGSPASDTFRKMEESEAGKVAAVIVVA